MLLLLLYAYDYVGSGSGTEADTTPEKKCLTRGAHTDTHANGHREEKTSRLHHIQILFLLIYNFLIYYFCLTLSEKKSIWRLKVDAVIKIQFQLCLNKK